MRARNIKPSLFKNELLGQADPLYTLLFEGLWCAADREGRLEDRTARLRAEIFPYRPAFDIELGLNWLEANHFIDRYTVGGVAIIQVLKFSVHQRPHSNEVPSVLPAKVSSASHQGRKRSQLRKAAVRSDSLLSDTGSLSPDTGMGIADPPPTALTPEVDVDPSNYWDAIKNAYPQGNPRQRWPVAKRHAVKLVADGRATWELLYRNVCAYAEFCDCNQRKVLDVRNYFSENDEPWANSWKDTGIRSPAFESMRARPPPAAP